MTPTTATKGAALPPAQAGSYYSPEEIRTWAVFAITPDADTDVPVRMCDKQFPLIGIDPASFNFLSLLTIVRRARERRREEKGRIITWIGIDFQTADQSTLADAGIVSGNYQGNMADGWLSLAGTAGSFEKAGMICAITPLYEAKK